MKIGIIGAGNIGGTLTRRFTALGHRVFVANSRGPKTLQDLAAETGATPVTVEQAAQAGDVVVVTIPLKNVSSLPAGLFANTPKNVVVVDTGNYYPRRRGRVSKGEQGAQTGVARYSAQPRHVRGAGMKSMSKSKRYSTN